MRPRDNYNVALQTVFSSLLNSTEISEIPIKSYIIVSAEGCFSFRGSALKGHGPQVAVMGVKS